MPLSVHAAQESARAEWREAWRWVSVLQQAEQALALVRTAKVEALAAAQRSRLNTDNGLDVAGPDHAALPRLACLCGARVEQHESDCIQSHVRST